MTSCESPQTSSYRMPNSMAMRMPLMSASYLAMLFETGKWKRIADLMRTPRGETKTSPTLAPFFISDLLKYIV